MRLLAVLRRKLISRASGVGRGIRYRLQRRAQAGRLIVHCTAQSSRLTNRSARCHDANVGQCRRRRAPAITEAAARAMRRSRSGGSAGPMHAQPLTCRARTAEIGRHAAMTQRAGASESTGMSPRPRFGEWDGPAEALPAQPRQTDRDPTNAAWPRQVSQQTCIRSSPPLRRLAKRTRPMSGRRGGCAPGGGIGSHARADMHAVRRAQSGRYRQLHQQGSGIARQKTAP